MGAGFVSWRGESLDVARNFPNMPMMQELAFVDPRYFRINSALNPHMLDESGQLKTIDPDKARLQWQALVDTYRQLGFKTHILEAKHDCPDMVFCANQSLPTLSRDGQAGILLSHMASDSRHLEVASIGRQLADLGYRLEQLGIPRQKSTTFEGTGDALWVPGRRLLLGGYGFRTHRDVYRLISEQLDVSIVTLSLPNPRFYHLDTCLSILDERTALACRDGFTDEGWQSLEKIFDQVLEVPLKEADSPGFAANAHCPDGHHVILQKGNEQTQRLLKAAGYEPLPVDTTEFIKSGGSVFCMKLALFAI